MRLTVCIFLVLLSIASCSDKPRKSSSSGNDSVNMQDYSQVGMEASQMNGAENININIMIKESLFEYTITNNTSESYFTWIDFHPIDTSYHHRVAMYFYTPHGDFSLLQLLTETVNENSLLYGSFIGTFFLKEIRPNSSFKYIVDPLDEKSYLEFIRFIYFLKTNNEITGNFCNRQFLWQKDYVLVTKTDQKKFLE